jgi:hypothetical protein
MLKKAIITGVILTAIFVCLLNASTILSFFQGSPYRKVVVSEGQVSVENFGTEESPKGISFTKEGKYLYVMAGLSPQDMKAYVPTNDDVYYLNGFEIVVSEVHQDWFILLVKPEWK